MNTTVAIDPQIRAQDDEQLRVLSILYLVYAAFDALSALWVSSVVAFSGEQRPEAETT